jgi:hypothetical protein
MPTIVARAVPTVHGEAVGHHALPDPARGTAAQVVHPMRWLGISPARSPEAPGRTTGRPRCRWKSQDYRAAREKGAGRLLVIAPRNPAVLWIDEMDLSAREAASGLIGLPAVLGCPVVRDPALHSIARVRAEE